MKVPVAVLGALRGAETDENRLVLTGPRMDPKLYRRVNEVLEAVGGRWTTTAQAHLFPGGAAEAIAPVLDTGSVVTLREKIQDAQYFPTPAPVVARLMELAAIEPGMEVLEPSAGSGAIASAAAAAGAVVDCVERDPGYAAVLLETGAARQVSAGDFLAQPPEPRYDRVVMNPPFTRGADVEHVTHALRFLKPGGLLVSVMSWAVTEQTRKTAAFRSLVEQRGGTAEALPAAAFAKAGTDVDTVIVTIPASARAGVPATVWPQRDIPEQSEPEHQSPLEILAELKQNLRDAMAEFDSLERLLTEPFTHGENKPVEVIELPTPQQEQLTFDALGEASSTTDPADLAAQPTP